MEVDKWKKIAAEEAVKSVKDGMAVGLGTGSTAKYVIESIGELGLKVTGVPTSKATERLAEKAGIRLVEPNDVKGVDIAIDGADQVGPEKDLIKGGGGALTREKIVAGMAQKFIVVVDETKIVPYFSFPVAVEVLDFNLNGCKRALEKLGASASVRMKGEKRFKTDNGNRILDCKFGNIQDPAWMEKRINNIPGVIENGIFPHIYVSEVIVGGRKGVWRL